MKKLLSALIATTLFFNFSALGVTLKGDTLTVSEVHYEIRNLMNETESEMIAISQNDELNDEEKAKALESKTSATLERIDRLIASIGKDAYINGVLEQGLMSPEEVNDLLNLEKQIAENPEMPVTTFAGAQGAGYWKEAGIVFGCFVGSAVVTLTGVSLTWSAMATVTWPVPVGAILILGTMALALFAVMSMNNWCVSQFE